MAGPSSRIVIDARPQGTNGPLAEEPVLGRSVLAHHLDLARRLSSHPIAIHARLDDHPRLRSALTDLGLESAPLVPGPPPEHTLILRTDRLYDLRRLRQSAHRGLPAERAVLWRLDTPTHLESASEELLRRSSYQPLGRFWAFAPARSLARALAPTFIRPNLVTLASAGSMFLACALVAFGPSHWLAQLAAASALALGLILDTADGHLARLQGTASAFGRWLDAFLDETADLALHAAIAWSCFTRFASPAWLLLGMLYVSARYLFLSSSILAQNTALDTPETTPALPSPRPLDRVRSLVAFLGHADLRWHLWIILAALGRLEIALIAYTAYFTLRLALSVARKAVLHA